MCASWWWCSYLPELANSKSFPVLEKTISATSASHSTASSCAFFNKPPRLLENVTCLLVAFSIFFISIFPLPICPPPPPSSSSPTVGSVVSSPSLLNKRQTIRKAFFLVMFTTSFFKNLPLLQTTALHSTPLHSTPLHSLGRSVARSLTHSLHHNTLQQQLLRFLLLLLHCSQAPLLHVLPSLLSLQLLFFCIRGCSSKRASKHDQQAFPHTHTHTHTHQQQRKEAEPAPMSTATNQRTKFERATFNERRTNE